MKDEDRIDLEIQLEKQRMAQKIALTKAQRQAEIEMIEAQMESMNTIRKIEKRNEAIDKLLEE